MADKSILSYTNSVKYLGITLYIKARVGKIILTRKREELYGYGTQKMYWPVGMTSLFVVIKSQSLQRDIGILVII